MCAHKATPTRPCNDPATKIAEFSLQELTKDDFQMKIVEFLVYEFEKNMTLRKNMSNFRSMYLKKHDPLPTKNRTFNASLEKHAPPRTIVEFPIQNWKTRPSNEHNRKALKNGTFQLKFSNLRSKTFTKHDPPTKIVESSVQEL